MLSFVKEYELVFESDSVSFWVSEKDNMSVCVRDLVRSAVSVTLKVVDCVLVDSLVSVTVWDLDVDAVNVDPGDDVAVPDAFVTVGANVFVEVFALDRLFVLDRGGVSVGPGLMVGVTVSVGLSRVRVAVGVSVIVSVFVGEGVLEVDWVSVTELVVLVVAERVKIADFVGVGFALRDSESCSVLDFVNFVLVCVSLRVPLSV